jgi:hypothetical protein
MDGPPSPAELAGAVLRAALAGTPSEKADARHVLRELAMDGNLHPTAAPAAPLLEEAAAAGRQKRARGQKRAERASPEVAVGQGHGSRQQAKRRKLFSTAAAAAAPQAAAARAGRKLKRRR